MPDRKSNIAVLTGDLVASGALGPNKIARAFAALEDSAAAQGDWHGAALNFTRNRGDGWQVVLARPKMALRAALVFRAALRAEGDEFDTYIAVAEGRLTHAPYPDLNDETAEVFVSSGNHLDDIKTTSSQQRFVHAAGTDIDAVFVLADHISQGWTPPQAAAVLPFLTPGHHPSYTEVARMQGKSRQSITKSLAAASLEPLRSAIWIVEGFAHE